MWPLIICSVLAIAVVIDRAWAFYQYNQIDTRSLRARVLEKLRDGDIAGAAHLCANTPGPVSAVLLSGLQAFQRHETIRASDAIKGIMEEAMEDYTLHAMSAVEKRFRVLSTIGNVAPLLGMTGTVTGMIASFQSISETGGMQAAGEGIAEALITTATGLIIAVIAVIPYNLFMGQAESVELEIEEARAEVLDTVMSRAAGEGND
jgi:biopolymer transport protein ExbB